MNIFGKLTPVLKIGDVEIRFYAICILTGAILAYLIIRHRAKKAGYSVDLIDTILITAFPAGILGARIWWCVSDAQSPWRRPDGNFWGFITEFRDGGLAIQGGVVVGALVAILVIKLHKKTPLFYLMDIGLPQVLLAQACGRWGNFFNQEVYGQCIPAEKLNWLPKFIQEQMAAGDGGYGKYTEGIACEAGQAAVPLFLYESFFNLIGWAILTFLLPKVWKNRKNGDIFPLYFVWYGIVRLIMEPIRNQEFIMSGWGKGFFSASVVTSIVFIVGGILVFVLNRVLKLYEKVDKNIVVEEKKEEAK